MVAAISLTTHFLCLASDVGLDQPSVAYCIKRLEHEGAPFLTQVLPELSKSVLSSLEKGTFVRPKGFPYKRKTLAVFRPFLDRIFNPATGVAREVVDAKALKSLRQLCDYFYKLSLPFDDQKLSSYEAKFVSTDNELRSIQWDLEWIDRLRKDFETYYPRISAARIEDVFSEHRPRPGSGTYSAHHLDQQKWYLKRTSVQATTSAFKAMAGYFKPYPAAPDTAPITADVDYSEVLFVPKDSRGPRTIVREPYHTLKAQMGFHDWIKNGLEKATSYRVNFVSQSTNQGLALLSSKDKSLATIDLKDASDRVSYFVFDRIFRQSPACRFMLQRSTRKVKLPSGQIHDLAKVAGMGSGLTFPLMSLLITLTVTRAIVNRTGSSYASARKLVYVYGDDIVVPVHLASLAYNALERVGLMVNESKSYRFSHFRESCGGDFYDGVDVAPVRCRLSNSECETSGTTLLLKRDCYPHDLVWHAKECVKGGLPRTAEFLYRNAEKALGRLPAISGDSSVLGRWQEITPVYPVDETGTYREIRVVVAVPVKHDVRYPVMGSLHEGRPTMEVGGSLDPYVYLGSKLLGKDAPFDPFSKVLNDRSTFGEVSIPHQIKFERMRVSAFRLMG